MTGSLQEALRSPPMRRCSPARYQCAACLRVFNARQHAEQHASRVDSSSRCYHADVLAIVGTHTKAAPRAPMVRALSYRRALGESAVDAPHSPGSPGLAHDPLESATGATSAKELHLQRLVASADLLVIRINGHSNGIAGAEIDEDATNAEAFPDFNCLQQVAAAGRVHSSDLL